MASNSNNIEIFGLLCHQQMTIFQALIDRKILVWEKYLLRLFYNIQEFKDLKTISKSIGDSDRPVHIRWGLPAEDAVILFQLPACAATNDATCITIHLSTISPFYNRATYGENVIDAKTGKVLTFID